MDTIEQPEVCGWLGDKRWVYSITFDEALEGCRRYGYLGAMSITDALNRPGDAASTDAPGQRDPGDPSSPSTQPDQRGPAGPADQSDLLWLNRTFLHHQGYGPFFSQF